MALKTVPNSSWMLITIMLILVLVVINAPVHSAPQAGADPDEEDKTATGPVKYNRQTIVWFKPPERTCPIDNDFCPMSQLARPKTADRRQQGGAFAGFAAHAAENFFKMLGHVNAGLGEVSQAGDAANGIVSGAISNANGLSSLIRQGINLAREFGLGPKVNAIVVDNRCGNCDLWVRCTSQGKDSGWIPLEHPDGYILKFVTHLPGWEYGLGNFGFVFWTCEYKDDNTGRIITQPAFGGSAPRETINLFEVRKKGLYRMDQETGRIDNRQAQIWW